MSQKHEAWVEGAKGDFLVKEGVTYTASETQSLLDWITLDIDAAVEILEEMVNGVSTNVLAEHNLTSAVAIPTDFNYTLKSSRGNGFSKIKLSAGNGLAFRLQPNIA